MILALEENPKNEGWLERSVSEMVEMRFRVDEGNKIGEWDNQEIGHVETDDRGVFDI